MRFKADDEAERAEGSPNASETEDDEVDEQSRTIYATKSKRPPPKPNKQPSSFPLIPKEQYDQLSDQLKEILKEQHAYYCNLSRKVQSETQSKLGSSRRSQHYTTILL